MGGEISNEQVERHFQELREDAVEDLRQRLRAALTRGYQLEKLNATLAAEVDRQRGVMEAAQRYVKARPLGRITETATAMERLRGEVATYEASREGADGR